MRSTFDTLVRAALKPKAEPVFNTVKPKATTLGRPLKPNKRTDQKELEFNPQNCPMCSKEFMPTVWQYQHQRQSKYTQAGPFCSKYCASQYNGQRRNGGDKLPTVPITIKENSH